MSDRAEDTPAPFTMGSWAKLDQLFVSVPRDLQGIRDDLRESTAAIRAAMQASDDRCDQQMKLANQRIDDAHQRMHNLDRRLARWTVRLSAYAGCLAVVAALIAWALKAFKNIG